MIKIFLAEDNEDNYLVVKSNLRKLTSPTQLLWAKNGHLAMEALKEETHIDIFLIDIEMPIVDGVKLAKWIKEQERFAHTPMVAITASVFADMKKMYLEKGFCHILEKPFDRKSFLEMLHDVTLHTFEKSV